MLNYYKIWTLWIEISWIISTVLELIYRVSLSWVNFRIEIEEPFSVKSSPNGNIGQKCQF